MMMMMMMMMVMMKRLVWAVLQVVIGITSVPYCNVSYILPKEGSQYKYDPHIPPGSIIVIILPTQTI